MKAELLDSMRIPGRAVAFDVETHMVQPGLLTPPLVVGSMAELVPGGRVVGELLPLERCRQVFEAMLADDSLIIVGANIAFDMAVMLVDAARRGVNLAPAVFRAYALGRVFDVQHCEALHHVAIGSLGKDPRTGASLRDPETDEICGYRLSVIVDLVLGRVDAKANDTWRERYALLEPHPIEQWPAEARQYPIDDAVNTLEAALAQAGHIPNVGPHHWPSGGPGCSGCGIPAGAATSSRCTTTYRRYNTHDLAVQTFKAFALHLGACWGVRSDPVATEFLIATVEESRASVLGAFIERGFVRADGSEDQSVVKRAVALAYGCTGICTACGGSGKVYNKFSKRDPSKPVGKPINCTGGCNGTGLDLKTGTMPLTEKGNVQKGKDPLTESGDDFLMDYAEAKADNKITSTYGPFLRQCAEVPGNLRPNAILETGRVSYSGVIQTLPRQVSARLAERIKERRARIGGPLVIGVRDCIVPRPDWLFDSEDYSGGELVTHAESCVRLVGYSRMGEALNAGLDVHSALGATTMGVDYGLFVEMLAGKHGPEKKALAKAYRQASKPPNFGFPGRMGAARLVLQARGVTPDTPHHSGPSWVWDGKAFVSGYKGTRFCLLIGGAERCGAVKVTEWNRQVIPPTCRACIECGEHLKAEWQKQWPENVPYLKRIVPAAEERGYVIQHYSERIRGGVDGGSIANGWFQALLADITGRAQIRVSTEQYVQTVIRSDAGAPWCPKPSQFEGTVSPLFGTRSILFAHDELFGESPASIAAEAAERKTEIMVEEFRKACPHHVAACKAEPTLMRRWYKAAECVRDANGRLIPWEPKEK